LFVAPAPAEMLGCGVIKSTMHPLELKLDRFRRQRRPRAKLPAQRLDSNKSDIKPSAKPDWFKLG
jgi:hypothetical protein